MLPKSLQIERVEELVDEPDLFRYLRASTPLVPLPILYRRAVAVPNAAVVLKSMVGAAQLYVLTLYFQDALGRTPLVAGLLFIPMTLASVVASPVAGRLTTRLGTRQTAA